MSDSRNAANAPADAPAGTTEDAHEIDRELLVEDVSIDGMCGVY